MVKKYVRYPLLLCNVGDLLNKHGVHICDEKVRLLADTLRAMFAAEIGRKRLQSMCQHTY